MNYGTIISNIAIDELTCTFCKAKPGEMCRTKSGNIRARLDVHSYRWQAAESIYDERKAKEQ